MHSSDHATLVIIDGLLWTWLDNLKTMSKPIHVLGLGIASETIKLELQKKNIPLSSVKIYNLNTQHAERLRVKLRKQVTAFYAELPRIEVFANTTLCQQLFAQDEEVWWLSVISEKSIFRGHLIRRFYELLLIKHCLHELPKIKQITLSISDQTLVQTLTNYFTSTHIVSTYVQPSRFGIYRIFLQRQVKAIIACFAIQVETILKKILCCFKGKAQNNDFQFYHFSFYPSWWKHPFCDINANDQFIGIKQGDLKARAYIARNLVWLQFTRWQQIIQFIFNQQIFSKLNLVPLQAVVKIKHLFQLFQYISLFKVWQLQHSSSIQELEFANIKISNLVLEELFLGLSNREFYRNLLIRSAVKSINLLSKPLSYRLEFQPFERALLLGIHNRLKTIGFQHVALGEDCLSHIFEPREMGNEILNPIPMPDQILTTGEHTRNMLINNGLQEDKVHLLGALRYHALRTSVRQDIQYKPDMHQAKLFIPVSLDLNEAITFAPILGQALQQCDKNFQIILKPHPANDHGELFKKLLQSYVVTNIEVIPAKQDFYLSLTGIMAVVMTGSSIGLEAMALGVMPIVYVNHHQFSVTVSALYAVQEALCMVYDVPAMVEALNALSDNYQGMVQSYKRHWPCALKRMFGDLTADLESNFLNLIK